MTSQALICSAPGVTITPPSFVDLLELDGNDLRRTPIEERKHALANLLYRGRDGIAFNKHYDDEGAVIFKRLRARLRGHRIEAARLAIPIWSGQRLAQDQEPSGTGGEARGGRGLGR
jgi:hypothetical protein